MSRVEMIFVLWFIFTTLISSSQSYKILGLFPYHGKSHVDVFLPIMTSLSARGHEVTVVSHYPLEDPLERYEDISLKGSLPLFKEAVAVGEIHVSKLARLVATPIRLANVGNVICETSFQTKEVQDLLSSDRTFDLIVTEIFASDCFLGFVHKFKAPVVELMSSGLLPWANGRFGQPNNPSYIPTCLLGYSDRMTFLERLENAVIDVYHTWIFTTLSEPKDQQIIDKYFGSGLPKLETLKYNASLLLVNTHYTLNLPRPNVPSVIEIAGVHVGKRKRLESNIEKWINDSTDGVIYFSLGSVLKGHTFPEEKKRQFLRAFARLPQRVLWKWENDTMPGKPDNVMIQKWMPQFDILCHPNVKAFISHGGLLGTIEAVHCGVPVIVMPQFGDQFTNARALEANGGGVILQLPEATEEKVYEALKTVLRSEFKKKAEELSERFRDRPLSPLDTAIYWVEYVARHRGAPFMRTAAVDMPLYQYLLLDVVAFLAAIALIWITVIYYSLRAVIKFIVRRSQAKVKTN